MILLSDIITGLQKLLPNRPINTITAKLLRTLSYLYNQFLRFVLFEKLRPITKILVWALIFLSFITAYRHIFVQATSATIRQEINIIDGTQAVSTTSSAIVQLDTTKYNGSVSYYFEIVTASASASTDTVTLTRSGTTTNDASISLAGTAANVRVRSTAFTPPASTQTQYVVKTGAAHSIKAARIIIIQTANPITSTETQVEIGNQETAKTNTSTAPLTSPKYWKYSATNYDGAPTFFAEVTKAQSASQTSVTVTLQQDDGAFGTWSDVATIVNANTTTAATRFRVSFTPTNGRNYRLSSFESSGTRNYSIYNAKIIIDQSGGTFGLVGNQYKLGDNNSMSGVLAIADISSSMVLTVYNGGKNSDHYSFDGTNWSRSGGGGITSANDGTNVKVAALTSTRVAFVQGTTLKAYDFTSSWALTGSAFTLPAQGTTVAALSSTQVAIMNTSGQLTTYTFNGTTWSQVGNALTITGADNSGLAALSSSQVAMYDASLGVIRTYSFNGTTWSQVGNSFTPTSSGYPAIAALSSTRIAISSNATGDLKAYDFNGTNWSQVGSTYSLPLNFSTITALSSTRVAVADSVGAIRALDFNGTSWSKTGNFLYFNITTPKLTAMSSTRIAELDGDTRILKVFDTDGTNWSETGTGLYDGFKSYPGISLAALSSTQVAVTSENGTTITLQTYSFNGSSWSTVGSGLAISFASGNPPVSIAALSSTRIAYYDSANQQLRVYDFNGSTWSQTGSSLTITSGANAVIGMTALSSSRIAYIDDTNDQLRAYDFNGSTWSLTGTGLAITSVLLPNLTDLSSTDVAYIDSTNNQLRDYSFNGSTWSQVGSSVSVPGNNFTGMATLSSSKIAFLDGGNQQLRTYSNANPTKIETQYLLNNTAGTATGLQNYKTLWDSTEWSVINTSYTNVIDSTSASSSAKLQDVDNANADVIGSTATGKNQVFSSALTMPTTGHQIDANITASANTVTAERIDVVATIAGNASPAAPTLSTPASGAANISLTPSFTLSTTDSDGDAVQYRIYLYQSDCSTSIGTFAQASSGTGWDNGSTAYTSGATATYTYQGTLADNTTYCWKADAIDPTGSAVYGTTSGTRLFTTKATALSQNHYRWRNDDGYETSGSSSAGIIRPNGDVSVAWTVTGAATHFGALTAAGDQVTQPTAGSVSENVNSSTNGQVDTYDMGTLSGSGSYNEVDVWVYAKTAGNDDIGVSINVAGTTQQTVTPTTSDAWFKVTFSGLSMTQTNLDGLQVTLTQIRSGSADSVTVETMYAEVFNSLTAATYMAAQDTVVSGVSTGSNVRLRFEIANTDTQAGTPNLSLEYAAKSGTCSASTFSTIPTTSGSATQMSTSTFFANGDATTSQLTATGTFTAGKMVESTNTSTGALTIPASNYTEVEFVFQGNASAAGNTYCFRLTNNSTALSTYSIYPEITFVGAAAAPTTDQVMRGGTWFNNGAKQPIYWAQ